MIDIMGWTTGKMTLVYQHITDGVRKDVAVKVGSYLWGETSSNETPEGRPEETPPDKGEQPKSNSSGGPSADHN